MAAEPKAATTDPNASAELTMMVMVSNVVMKIIIAKGGV